MGAIHKGGGEGLRTNIFWVLLITDPPATYVRGLGLSPKYSFFMSSPALLATGWPFFQKKSWVFGVTKGVFGLKMVFLH